MIKEIYLKKSLSFIEKYSKNYDKNKEYIIKYGLESIYLSIVKLIPILILSIIFGLIRETLIFIATYNIIRTFAFGMHATKRHICFISSAITFILIPFLCKILEISIDYKIIISVLCLVTFALYAPADTEKRPIINKKKRIFLKIMSVIITIIYIIVIFTSNNRFLINILLFSMITEAFMIHPLAYKMFKMPYNNYVDYIKNKNMV